MIRRRYLTIAGTAVATTLAGCSQGDDNDGDTNGDSDAADDGRGAFRDDLIERLEVGMVTIETLEWNEEVLELEYTTEAETEDDLVDDVAVIAGSFAGIYDEHDIDIERFESFANTEDGDPFGSFYVDPEWAEQFKSDEITDIEYVELISETIELA
ncbi:MAG: hypothetical protein ACOC8O_00840 [Natronomonas sp.]